MKFLFVFLSAFGNEFLAQCAGHLTASPKGVFVDTRRGDYRVRGGDVLEVAYDDQSVEYVVVRVEHRRVYFPI